MAIADDIEALIACRPGLTEAEIATALFGDAASPQRISNACRSLLKSHRMERRGRGGRNDPFRYFAKGTLSASSLQVMRS